MKSFVLEVLDGEQSGTVVELGEARIRIGRRADNELALSDEKCSGHHAEIVFEDGRHVLRDLGSTNGTTLDGRRVQEVVLSPRDVVVLGRVRVCYRAADDAPSADGSFDDFRMGQVDAARLARSSRRRGSLVWTAVFVLVLAAGGYFAWRSWSPAGDGAGPRQTQPLAIDGNRLPAGAASLEVDDGWVLQALPDALGFDVAVGRAQAHSGSAALIATAAVAAGEDDAAAAPRSVLAVARSAEPVRVAANDAIRLSAWVRTSGGAQFTLHAVFGSAEDPAFVRSGAAPMSATEGYREVVFELRAPRGADRCTVELVAFVPDQADEVLVDDIGLQIRGDAPAVAGTAGGATLAGAGASLRVDAVALPVLLAVEPLPGDDPWLQALAAHGLLTPGDAALDLQVEALGDRGFALRWTGATAVAGLALILPAESAVVRTRGDAAAFVARDADFAAEGVRELLCGSADNRALLRLPSAAVVRGLPQLSHWRIELPGSTSFELHTVFTEQVVRARDAVRRARREVEAGRPGAALELLEEVVGEAPHDAQALREAQELRAEVVAGQERVVEDLLREGADAEFFDARVGYRREIAAIDAVIGRYGEASIGRIDELQAMRQRMEDGLAALDAREAGERAERLRQLGDAFEQAGNDALARFVRAYVTRIESK